MRNYPRGKLNQNDEGELQIRIGVQDRTVVLDFGKPIHWLGFDAATARAVGERLVARANEITQRLPHEYSEDSSPMKRALKSRAYTEAASLLNAEMSAVDLPPDLSEEEENEMREFIRDHIVGELRAKSERIRNRR